MRENRSGKNTSLKVEWVFSDTEQGENEQRTDIKNLNNNQTRFEMRVDHSLAQYGMKRL